MFILKRGEYCPNVHVSNGHQVIDITNGHFIHAGPLLKRDWSFYLSISHMFGNRTKQVVLSKCCLLIHMIKWGKLVLREYENIMSNASLNMYETSLNMYTDE